jgi:hypothetical protein
MACNLNRALRCTLRWSCHMHARKAGGRGFREHSEKVEPQRQPFASRQASRHVRIAAHAFVLRPWTRLR